MHIKYTFLQSDFDKIKQDFLLSIQFLQTKDWIKIIRINIENPIKEYTIIPSTIPANPSDINTTYKSNPNI